jgi:hypothetical protein
VKSEVDAVTVEQAFFRELRFSRLGSITAILRTLLHLLSLLPKGKQSEIWKAENKKTAFDFGEQWEEKYFHTVFL